MARLPPIAKQLKSDLAYWLKTLRLQDWNISLYLGGDVSPTGRRAAAAVNIDVFHKQAEIRIGQMEGYDPEESLVHELLHLHIEPWTVQEESTDEIVQEQFLNIMAKALVGLRHVRG